jgi:hypothetical protein
MLELFEENGRGRSSSIAALPGRLHSGSGSLLSWTIQLAAQRENWLGAGETELVDLYPIR